MLKSIAKSREIRSQQKANELIQNGLQLVRKKLYKQATLDFNNALKLNQEVTELSLEKYFKRFKHGGNHEATLAIGLILIKVKKDDFKLANILGNCSRRQKEYKQANNLYRYALRINKQYHVAYYNLAASMAKVELYDSEVKTAIDRFPNDQGYILPDYVGSPDFLKHIQEKLKVLKEKARDKRVLKLLEEKEKCEEKSELLQVHRINHLLEKEENNDCMPTFDEIHKYIQIMIKQAEGTTDEEVLLKKQRLTYNLIIISLENENGRVALECLDQLEAAKAKFEFLVMMRALALSMEGDINQSTALLINLLGESPNNRYLNVNLGLLYRRLDNELLSFKYLAIGSVLLERSEGLYKLSDLMIAATDHMDNGRNKKALQLFKVVVSEEENPRAWESIGKIHIQLEQLDEAVDAFKNLQKIEPKSQVAEDYLYQIHDFYFSEGEEMFRDRKYKAAVLRFEKAMTVLRLPETLKRAASIYTVLRDKKRSVELLEECEEIKEQIREQEQEKLRLSYIAQAKKFRKVSRTQKAIEYFELAFRLKLDKDVFMYLAYLYKALNRVDDLQDLLNRWNKMVELEDRLKQYKDSNREGEE